MSVGLSIGSRLPAYCTSMGRVMLAAMSLGWGPALVASLASALTFYFLFIQPLYTLRVADPAPVEEIRVRTFDTFQRVGPRVKTARPVSIIDIDEKSLAKFGQWPWPRTRIADMIAELTKLGGVAIGFDIMFAEADRLNPAIAADTFRKGYEAYLTGHVPEGIRQMERADAMGAPGARSRLCAIYRKPTAAEGKDFLKEANKCKGVD